MYLSYLRWKGNMEAYEEIDFDLQGLFIQRRVLDWSARQQPHKALFGAV